MRGLAAAALLACTACGGTAAVIDVSLTTAPGSVLLDQVQHLRLTLTLPPQVVEADRDGDGFDLALEVNASGVTGRLIVEGFDAAGALVACGESPPFPVAALNARIVVYMAPPMSIAPAPHELAAGRSGVATAILQYGVLFAGGADPAGVPSDAVAIYNAYDHSLESADPMPEPRSQLQLGTGTSGSVFFYGGFDGTNTATATYLRFDDVAPRGQYTPIADTGIARAGERAVIVGPNHFLITGSPVIELALAESTTRSDIASLPRAGAPTLSNDGITFSAIFAGSTGIIRFRDGIFTTLSPTARVGADAATLAGNEVVIAGGGPTATDLLADVLVVDAGTGVVTTIADALDTPRANPSVTATDRHVVIAGGVDAAGTALADAEVLELPSFAHVATIPFAAAAPHGTPLPNNQVLFDDRGALHLFTPPPPAR